MNKLKISNTLSLTHYIYVGILLGLLVGFFVPRLLAYIPGTLGLIFIIAIYLKDRILIKPKKIEFLLFAGVIALAGLSAVWSINPEFSLERTIKLALIILPSLFLLQAMRHLKMPPPSFFFLGLLIVHFLASSFLIFEQVNGRPISGWAIDYTLKDFHLNRSFVVYAFLSMVTIFVFSQKILFTKKLKYPLLTGLIGLSLVTLYFSGSQTAQLSFLCGLIFFLFFPTRSLFLTKAMWAGIITLFFIFPFIFKPIMQAVPEDIITQGVLAEASIIHRFDVWNFTITEIQKKPLNGHGIESQRFMKADEWMEHQRSDSILHAHNIILQLWIEFGVLGIFTFIAFLAYLYKRISSSENNENRKIYLALFATIFCCAMTGYGVWQSWQIGLFLFFNGVAISIAQKETSKS